MASSPSSAKSPAACGSTGWSRRTTARGERRRPDVTAPPSTWSSHRTAAPAPDRTAPTPAPPCVPRSVLASTGRGVGRDLRAHPTTWRSCPASASCSSAGCTRGYTLAPGPHRSVEQALHLAGFGPECARKGCVDDAITDHAAGHNINDATDAVVEVLLALDPAASRYGIDEHAARLPYRATDWRPDCRYMATHAPELYAKRVESVVREARRFVDDCVIDIWSDGVMSADALRWPGG